MKAIGIIGAALGALSAILGAYLQFALAPKAEVAISNMEHARDLIGEAYYGSIQQAQDFAAIDAAVDFGVIVMGSGLLAFLVSIVPAFKKINIAWLGVALGTIMFFLGGSHGTHMFS
jgi:hypothetical protein